MASPFLFLCHESSGKNITGGKALMNFHSSVLSGKYCKHNNFHVKFLPNLTHIQQTYCTQTAK